MNSHCNDLHEQASCWCVPAEHVRPRFFYGQRLGVVDFSDWLWYHAGKQRFHNLNSHGVGILCGLRAAPYLRPEELTTTLLTITRGAAYDDCGREVIVPVDQCIDVAAWYLQNEERLAEAEWPTAGDDNRLCVGLRYRECPSDPAPAPRDPCGCDAGGCEYARVREGFELRLFTQTEMVASNPTAPTCDTYAALQVALSSNNGDQACTVLRQMLHDVMPAGCPPPSGDGWLWLACFNVTLAVAGDRFEVRSIVDPNNAIAERLELLSTVALQEMLLGLATSASTAGLVGVGPRVSGLRLESDGSALLVDIALYADTKTGVTTPLAESSFSNENLNPPQFFRLAQFNEEAGWKLITLEERVEYMSDEEHFRISLDESLGEGSYRLTVISPPDTPIVDIEMQPLLPLTYARNFQLTTHEDGALVLDPEFG